MKTNSLKIFFSLASKIFYNRENFFKQIYLNRITFALFFPINLFLQGCGDYTKTYEAKGNNKHGSYNNQNDIANFGNPVKPKLAQKLEPFNSIQNNISSQTFRTNEGYFVKFSEDFTCAEIDYSLSKNLKNSTIIRVIIKDKKLVDELNPKSSRIFLRIIKAENGENVLLVNALRLRVEGMEEVKKVVVAEIEEIKVIKKAAIMVKAGT